MSRLRRKRTKSVAAILVAAVLLGVGTLSVGAAAASYVHSRSLSHDAQDAAKSKFEITANDNSKTIMFPVGVHFSVFLDEEHYPKDQLTCAPGGVVAHASDMPVATLPLWAVRFDTIAPGSCRLSDRDFSATIVVEGN